jgi:serine/threonine-protein kinase RsbW
MPASSLTIRNDVSEIRRLSRWAGMYCEANQLEASEHRLSLVLEELVSNVVAYGYDDDSGHEIRIELDVNENVLTAVFIDDGRPFDPFKAQKPVMSGPIEERSVGGLGIHLVLTIMDNVGYERVDGHNRTTMSMKTTA